MNKMCTRFNYIQTARAAVIDAGIYHLLSVNGICNIPIRQHAYGDYAIPGCQNSAIVASSSSIKTIHSSLSPLTAGEQIVISSTLVDRCGMDHPAMAIIEARDSKGVTVFLAWQNFTMQANLQVEVGVLWMPEKAGEYLLRTLL